MANIKETCTVGIVVPGIGNVRAFEVCIDGQNVYVNYADCSAPDVHGSYHASGQVHFKIGRSYINWTGGPTGGMESMKFFRMSPGTVDAREDFWNSGWEVCKLHSILPALNSKADFLVNAQNLDGSSILGLFVSVVGDKVPTRSSVSGYPVVASHRFGNSVRVDIDAFIVP